MHMSFYVRLSGFTGPTLCTTTMVQSYPVDHQAALSTFKCIVHHGAQGGHFGGAQCTFALTSLKVGHKAATGVHKGQTQR